MLFRSLRATNRPNEAEPLMRRALAIDEQNLGQKQAEVVADLFKLTELLLETSQLAEAQPLMRRAVTTFLEELKDISNLEELEGQFTTYGRLLSQLGKTDEQINAILEGLYDAKWWPTAY